MFLWTCVVIGFIKYNSPTRQDSTRTERIRNEYYREKIYGIPSLNYTWITDPATIANIGRVRELAKKAGFTEVLLPTHALTVVNATGTTNIVAQKALSTGRDPCNLTGDVRVTLADFWLPKPSHVTFYWFADSPSPHVCDTSALLPRLDDVAFIDLILLAAAADYHDFSMDHVALVSGANKKIKMQLIVGSSKDRVNYELFQKFDNVWLRQVFDRSGTDIRSHFYRSLNIASRGSIRTNLCKFYEVIFGKKVQCASHMNVNETQMI